MFARKTYILAALAAIVFAVATLLSFELWRFKSTQTNAIIAEATDTTALIKTELETLLMGVQEKAETMGKTFGEREYLPEEIEEIIRQTALDNPEIRGVTVCYEPYAFSEEKKLFCPYYDKAASNFIYIEDNYDYTVPSSGTTWYTGVIENGAKWAEPYYGAAAEDWFLDYGVPFYWTEGEKKGQIRGIIDYTLSTEDFKDFVHEISVGKTSHEFIITSQGNLVTHPVINYVGNENLDYLIETEENANIRQGYQAMSVGETGYETYYSEENDSSAYFFYDTVAPADYRLGVIYLTKDMIGASTQTSRRIINIALAFSIFIVLVIAMIFGRDHLDRWEIEQLSFLTTGLLICIVILVGWLQHSKSRDYDVAESPAIIDNIALGSFVQDVVARADIQKTEPPIAVPTGLYIERLEFADSYNVNIGGQVWMKYPESLGENPDLDLGIRFPQMSPFAEASLIEEVHREIVPAQEGADGYLHLIWDFRVTLRLNLKYSQFPFDKRHLDIELDPISMGDNIILVPDLNGYQVTNPSQKPGISKDISLPGSEITRSYYNFALQDYATDFGYGSQSQFQAVPTLHYNIYLKRKLMNSFITYLVPIFVTLSLIYILILACEKTEARQGIIESMAAFFFVLIFSHIDLRKDIVTAELIFIEYFYFATYLMVILSTANLIAYTKSRTSLFDHNENQIYRAIYFPIFFSIILVVMLWKFY